MNLDDLTVGQVKEIQALCSVSAKAETKEIGGEVKIVILQRGWVAVGRYYRKGNECRLENAYTFGRWGTSKGLPELANEGPLTDTQLHKSDGPIRFHRGGEVFTIDCDESKWVKQCPKS